ncbi:unnamed protein product [Absidia cylindrospora]
MSSAKLRSASSSDAELIASIHISSWKSSYQNILPASYLDNDIVKERLGYWDKKMTKHMQTKGDSNGIIMVAENGEGKVIGFFAGEWDPTCQRGALLDHIHTLPQHQGVGAGRMMMNAFKQWAKQVGAPQAYLLVLEQNNKAIQFYERDGWQFADAFLSGPAEGINIPTRLYTFALL